MYMQLYAQRNTYVRPGGWSLFKQSCWLSTSLLTSAKAQGLPQVLSGLHLFSVYHTIFVGPYLFKKSITSRFFVFFPKMIWDYPLWSMNQQVLKSDPGSLAFAVEFKTHLTRPTVLWFAVPALAGFVGSGVGRCDQEIPWGDLVFSGMWNRYEHIGMVKQESGFDATSSELCVCVVARCCHC